MKNLILLFFLVGTTSLFAQGSTGITFSGGLWAGINKTTAFVGFVGPRLSVTFPINPKTKLEIGLNGIPGIVVKPEARLGLALGSTMILKKTHWKVKPVIGFVILKTNSWQTLYGMGFLF